MPRNIAHRAKRELERIGRRLRALCAKENGYTTAESLWAAVEKEKKWSCLLFGFCALAATQPENTALTTEVENQTESRTANHFKEDLFNLYKILRLRCTPQHQDEDAPGFASIGWQNRRWLRRTGLLRLRE